MICRKLISDLQIKFPINHIRDLVKLLEGYSVTLTAYCLSISYETL